MINDRQFILGKDTYMALGWKNVKLSNGFVLSYHDKLNVWLDNSRNIVILGNV